jgi:hypothetical protein
LLVAEVPLALEEPEHPANRGISGWIGKIGENVGGAGVAAPINDLHDLSLPAAELIERAVFHVGPSFGFNDRMSMD